jgi:hypothetical protein
MKGSTSKLDRYNDSGRWEILPLNATVETPVTSHYLSVVFLELKTDGM